MIDIQQYIKMWRDHGRGLCIPSLGKTRIKVTYVLGVSYGCFVWGVNELACSTSGGKMLSTISKETQKWEIFDTEGYDYIYIYGSSSSSDETIQVELYDE